MSMHCVTHACVRSFHLKAKTLHSFQEYIKVIHFLRSAAL